MTTPGQQGGASSSALGPSQLEELNDIFRIFDADRSGAIDPKEIKTQMRALGFEADNTTIYQLVRDLDDDGSQKLELEEFTRLIRDNLGTYTPEYTTRQSMQEVFDYMDDVLPGNRDSKIDASNLKRICKVLGDDLSDAEIDVMIEGADRDGKGFVSFDDFYAIMAKEAQRTIDEPLHIEAENKAEASSAVKGKWRKTARVVNSDEVQHVEMKEPTKRVSAMKTRKPVFEQSELQRQEAQVKRNSVVSKTLGFAEEHDEEDEVAQLKRGSLAVKKPLSIPEMP